MVIGQEIEREGVEAPEGVTVKLQEGEDGEYISTLLSDLYTKMELKNHGTWCLDNYNEKEKIHLKALATTLKVVEEVQEKEDEQKAKEDKVLSNLRAAGKLLLQNLIPYFARFVILADVNDSFDTKNMRTIGEVLQNMSRDGTKSPELAQYMHTPERGHLFKFEICSVLERMDLSKTGISLGASRRIVPIYLTPQSRLLQYSRVGVLIIDPNCGSKMGIYAHLGTQQNATVRTALGCKMQMAFRGAQGPTLTSFCTRELHENVIRKCKFLLQFKCHEVNTACIEIKAKGYECFLGQEELDSEELFRVDYKRDAVLLGIAS
jgi:hypothetical protein